MKLYSLLILNLVSVERAVNFAHSANRYTNRKVTGRFDDCTLSLSFKVHSNELG